MERLNIDNEWVAVIGALGGIGQAICAYLQKTSSCKLLLCDINERGLQNAASELQETHEVDYVQMDIMSRESQQQLFESIVSTRRVYAVIYAAGINFYGAALCKDIAYYDSLFMVNFMAPTYLMMLFHEYFTSKRIKGGMLFITSLAAKAYFPFQNIYSNSKIALDRYIRAYSFEQRGSGVTISQAYPGSVDTPMTRNSLVFASLSPLQKRLIAPVDVVAQTIVDGFIRKKPRIFIRGFSTFLFRVISYLSEDLMARRLIGRSYEKMLSDVSARGS